tara:strand:+ start:37843 stop:39588 length:1746 start_codon:yes stop_codon:yes gene_type:complete
MNKINYILIFLFLLAINSFGQGLDQTIVKTIGKEKMFLHFSTPVLLAGETLFYKAYCLERNNELSSISRIAFIELINEKLEVVVRQKIKLKNGHGYGDIFISTDVPSGNYKLLAYTQWMKNWGINVFFQSDISIINPFRSDQNTVLLSSENHSLTDTVDIINSDSKNNYGNISAMQININKKKFLKRDKVLLQLNAKNPELINGYFSILVHKKNDFNIPTNNTPAQFSNSEVASHSRNIFFIPEMRGELICGRISSTRPQTVVNQKKVVLSIPGDNTFLEMASTDENGKFCFNLSENHSRTEVLLQVLGSKKDDYSIELFQENNIDYSSLTFGKFIINPKMKESILKRSIHNQIENAYYGIKPDTIKVQEKQLPFYGINGTIYELNDYTRFPSFKETLVEIINNVWVSKKGEDHYSLVVEGINQVYNTGAYQPLVIVDGIVIQNLNSLMSYNANKIKSITVIREKYIVGSHIFEGVLDIVTFDNDYAKNVSIIDADKIILNTIVPTKKYFKQAYNKVTSQNSKHIPDYRYQLLWEPELNFSSSTQTLEFYTSDVSGNFEINIVGFTKSGKPIEITETFVVE